MTTATLVRIEAGARLPGFVPRAAVALLGGAAFLVIPPVPATVVLVAALIGAIVPALPAAWVGVAILGLSQLGRTPNAADWHPYVALALLHLLHVSAGLAAVIDLRGSVQARVLLVPLRRWAVIQVPAQLATGAVLALSGRIPTGAAAFAPIVACVAAVIAVVLIVRLAPRG